MFQPPSILEETPNLDWKILKSKDGLESAFFRQQRLCQTRNQYPSSLVKLLTSHFALDFFLLTLALFGPLEAVLPPKMLSSKPTMSSSFKASKPAFVSSSSDDGSCSIPKSSASKRSAKICFSSLRRRLLSPAMPNFFSRSSSSASSAAAAGSKGLAAEAAEALGPVGFGAWGWQGWQGSKKCGLDSLPRRPKKRNLLYWTLLENAGKSKTWKHVKTKMTGSSWFGKVPYFLRLLSWQLQHVFSWAPVSSSSWRWYFREGPLWPLPPVAASSFPPSLHGLQHDPPWPLLFALPWRLSSVLPYHPDWFWQHWRRPLAKPLAGVAAAMPNDLAIWAPSQNC